MSRQDPLEELHHQLGRSQPDLGELERIATMLRDKPTLLRASLTGLLDDNDRLETVATRSSDHPNSFAKIVLHTGDGFSIRLHVWHRTSDDVNPHGHRWEFASWVVTGTLRETTFAEADSDRRYVRTLYHRDIAGEAHHNSRGTATLRPLEKIDRPAGTVYVRTQEVLHTAVPVGGDPVTSLVLQRPASTEPALVYRRPEVTQLHEIPLRTNEVRRHVADVVDAIR